MYLMSPVKPANGALSPRSKMISLGLSNVETVPLRFRPLVKADAYPSPQNDRTQSNQKQGNQYHEEESYDYGDYKEDYKNSYNYQSEPSPEELRTQYTEFQRKIIAEQMSGNYDHNTVSPERAKALPQGLEYQGYLSAPSPRGNKPKFADYARVLGDDKTSEIQQTRRKFVRHIDEDVANGKLEGLVIGKQTDKESQFRAKREQQAAYQRQLTNDLRSKPVELERKGVERRAHSPQSQHVSLMERIGDRTSYTEQAEAERRRREAQQLLSTNRGDVIARLNEANSPENRKLRYDQSHSRGEEAAKFEEAPYRFIGGSQDAAKDKKRAMQEQYLAQLLADNGPPPSGRPMQREEPEYANKYGWTGLPVGGHSMDEANKSSALEEKQLKHAAYKRLLDMQKLQAEDLVRMDAKKYGKY
jgi:hypothetical protein